MTNGERRSEGQITALPKVKYTLPEKEHSYDQNSRNGPS